jgi:hypothetical protein
VLETTHSLLTVVSPPAPSVNDNQAKSIVAAEGYDVVMTASMAVTGVVRRLEGNMGNYAGGGSVTAIG